MEALGLRCAPAVLHEVTVDARRRLWKPWEHPFNRLAMELGVMTVSTLLDCCRMPREQRYVTQVGLAETSNPRSLNEATATLAHERLRGANIYELFGLLLRQPDVLEIDVALVAYDTLGATPRREMMISPVIRRSQEGLHVGTVTWEIDAAAQLGRYLLAVVPAPPPVPRRPYGR